MDPRIMEHWVVKKPLETMDADELEEHYRSINRSLVEVREAMNMISSDIEEFKRKVKEQAEMLINSLEKAASGEDLGHPQPENFKELALVLKMGMGGGNNNTGGL